MRAFAFISVLVGHKFFPELENAINSPTTHITIKFFLEMLVPLCVGGAAGVVVFFLTSGYIITHVLQSETTTDFVIKRIFRIYPLYVFAVLSEALVELIMQGTPIPPLSTMIPRLLLLGDFFDVPNALAGVEWTLRIEILFYAFMAMTKAGGLFSAQRYLPATYLIVALGLYAAPAFPSVGHWNAAYVNSYSLFLLIGSIIYLVQKGLTSKITSITLCLMLMTMFLMKIAAVQPNWKDSHYAAIATAIFLAALYFAPKLKDGRALRVVSDLTFSVYLFHNWLWEYLATPLSLLGLVGLPLKFAVAVLLFAVCYGLHITVERAGLKLGKRALQALKPVKALNATLSGAKDGK